MQFSYYTFIDFGRFFFIYDLFDTELGFIFDTLGLTAAALVLFLTIFAQYFGVEYMYREAFIMRLVYLLNFFATSVVFLFIVYDFFLILIVWELIGLFSLLLVNFYSMRVYTLKAAFKTFIFSRLSDFFIFISFFLLIVLINSTDLSIIFINLPFFYFYNIYLFGVGFNLLNLVSILIVLAGGIKAAQFSFHVWLPDAMEAPTPASALIHSSTLVIMGIYLIIRFNILFELTYGGNLLLMVLGGLTVALGAISAAFQNDIKKLVAYSTVSQMGYLFCGCGFLAYREVMFYLAIHAINKAFLFIIVGYIVHFFNGNTDMRFMGSLKPYAPDTLFLLLFVSLNLTGLPLTSGYFAKEFLVFQTLQLDWFSLFTRSLWFFSFFFTPFYMFFLNWSVFYKQKQNYIKVYSSFFGFFWAPGPSLFNKSLLSVTGIYSKLTSVVLFVFISFASFFGEFFSLTLFNFISVQDSIVSGSLFTELFFIEGFSTLFNISAADLLSFFILVSTISAVRYLHTLLY
jgi:NADH-quinone oxidoreductase subunit L